MLDSLYKLCDNEGLISDPAFEWARVAWTVEIDREGKKCAFISHRFTPPKEEGSNRKPKEQIKQFEVPRLFNPTTGGTRTSGDFAYFLVDKSEYALGAVAGEASVTPQENMKVKKRHSLFIEKIQDCAATVNSGELEILLRFLELVHEKGLPTALPENCVNNDLFAFRVGGDQGSHVHDNSLVRDYWKSLCSVALTDERPRNCLITGAPMNASGLFPTVKRVPGGSTSGAGLVSFNANAFESYGWKGNENASISPLAAIKASTALTRLVEPSFVNGDGEKLASRRRDIAADTAFVFWSPNAEVSDNFLEPINLEFEAGKSDPDEIHEMMRAPWSGSVPKEIEAEQFYALVISGAQGRIMIRNQIETSVGELERNLISNFKCLESVIQTPPPKSTETYPAVHGIDGLLKACVNSKRKSGVPGPMATALIRAVFQGVEYPSTMLVRALERERAEIFDDSWRASLRRDSRVAFFKAYLTRKAQISKDPKHQLILPSMNPTNTKIPYLYGRLFACYGEMQRLAHYPRQVNAGLIEKYFASFMTNPNRVFPNLAERYAHNRRKALRNQAGKWVAPTAAYQNMMVDKIIFELDPDQLISAFGLDEQALFILGFHHQRHWNTMNDEKRKAYFARHDIDPYSPELIIVPFKKDSTKTETETA